MTERDGTCVLVERVWLVNRLPPTFVYIILMALVSYGCKDHGVAGDDRPAGLYATVVDAGGIPVSVVNVHYIFYTTTNPLFLNASIQYFLATPELVTLRIFDPFDRELTTLIHGEQQPAGNYVILFDSSVTNGIYRYSVQTGDSTQTGSFFIRDDDIGRLEQKPPLVSSDQSGDFFLSPSVLGFGRSFQGQLFTEVIQDSISIVLFKANFKPFIRSFRLDTMNPTDMRFVLEPK